MVLYDVGSSHREVDVQKWKERIFPLGSRARKSFEYLCHVGCDPKALLSWVTVAVDRSQEPFSIYEASGTTKAALVKLPNKLEKIAGEIEAAQVYVGNYMRYIFENPKQSEQVRSRFRFQFEVYQNMPKLLRTLAKDLREINVRVSKNFGPKRFDFFRFFVVQLLQHVETSTKKPHYQEVSELLEHMHANALRSPLQSAGVSLRRSRRGEGMKNAVPTLFTSPDALKAHYQRWKKRGFT